MEKHISREGVTRKEKEEEKISHTGNTCVIKEYRYYTISLSKYHGWCQ